MHIGRLAARVAIGSLFVGHGTQKLFGWFGGPGPEGTEGMMTSLDLHPPRRNALAAGHLGDCRGRPGGGGTGDPSRGRQA